ncbi:hypothetical protein [Streptomyces sp. Ag109_G2-15]|uniref:hypothetical protein n=1 Tax=Streptomyces sp. Ag109_G2-15 TaxID=1938850 RepID=UPI000BDB72DB|nr:hypothetical protein [Streptomyces sp. Ag109_G2-15]SOD91122.1 hypothetical protein SAMN06272765_6769 [Streptomyces sp. Ag109_G2-15]
MRNERRLRRLAVGETVWYWTVRHRVGPTHGDCRLTLSFCTGGPAKGVGRRLSLVFAPCVLGVVSNTYFESGTVVRLPDRSHLNLYEPGAARRLLDAAAPALHAQPAVRNVAVDGWPYFAEVVDRADQPAGGHEPA